MSVVNVCTGVQHSVELQSSNTSTTTEQEKDHTQNDHDDDLVWKHSDTLLLIEAYRKYRPRLQDRTKKEIWELVASTMNDVQKGNKFTGAKRNKKWNNLELRYKNKRDKRKKREEKGKTTAIADKRNWGISSFISIGD